jgi:hypothetical protein
VRLRDHRARRPAFQDPPRKDFRVSVLALLSVLRPVQALMAKTACSECHRGILFPLPGNRIGPWLSLVERLVRDEEAASSNLAGPTI